MDKNPSLADLARRVEELRRLTAEALGAALRARQELVETLDRLTASRADLGHATRRASAPSTRPCGGRRCGTPACPLVTSRGLTHAHRDCPAAYRLLDAVRWHR